MLSVPMAQRLEGVHVGFLQQVTKLKGKRLRDGSWRKVVAEKVLCGEGEELLPRCDLCRIHMSEGRLTKHQRTARCEKNTQMRWRIRDVAIVDKYSEATFSLTRED